jgi:hypothetical protein
VEAVSEYDRRAEAWVRARYPAAHPDPGSVEFSNDCAAYASGGWANVDVSWTEYGQPRAQELSGEAWDYDWTQVIRELLEIDIP